MLTNNQVKLIRSLSLKKYRQQLGLFIIEGPKVVTELLKSKYEIENIFALEAWVDENSDLLADAELRIVNEKALGRISQFKSPNQVVAVVKQQHLTIEKFENEGVNLVLDNINDPGNLGTIIRICDWFGIENLICSTNTVDCYNAKTVQASMGSILRTNIYYTDLQEFIEQSPYPFYGASLEGQPINNTAFKKPCFIVMGSESHGISPELKPLLKGEFKIPRKGRAESLNVAVATAISLFVVG